MTIAAPQSLSEIAAYLAMRESECDAKNAERLEIWKRKLFRDPVSYEKPSQPPKWPAQRSSIDGTNVTPLRRKRA